MKKKILISLIVIAGVGSAGFAATRAFFNARVKSTDSSFTVGTLDLSVNNKQEGVDSFVVEGIGASGDIAGSKTWTVKNTGTLPGKLYFKLDKLVNYENGCNRAEKVNDPDCETKSNEEGNLGAVLNTSVYVNGNLMANSKLATTNQDDYSTQWNSKSDVIIPAGESVEVKMEWAAGQDGYDNRIQSDSLNFDTIFDLVQLVKQ